MSQAVEPRIVMSLAVEPLTVEPLTVEALSWVSFGAS